MISEIAFANFPLICKNGGLDFVIVDYEHGAFDYSEISRMLMVARLCGIEAIVRLPNAERKDIIKIMDMGADGVLLPMTNSAREIGQVVKYAKYRPIGERGISTMRAHTLYRPPAICEYLRQANERTKVFAQIETAQGVENIGEILAVEGVDGCMIGPNDLSADYGCLSDNNAPKVLVAIDRIADFARAACKSAGIITGNKNYLQRAKDRGFEMFSVGSELNALNAYCKQVTETIKL